MMDKVKFEDLIDYVKSLIKEKRSIKNLVAEIYNLYQEYLLSEEQEEFLYNIVDPKEKESCPADLWFDGYGCSDLYDFACSL